MTEVAPTAEYELDWADSPERGERRRRQRRILAVLVTVFLALAIVAGFLVAVGGMAYVRYESARDHADRAVDAARQFADDLGSDPMSAEASLKTAEDELRAARDEIDRFPMPILRTSADVDRNVAIVTVILDEYIRVADEVGPTAVALAKNTSIAKGENGESLSERFAAIGDLGPEITRAPEAVRTLRDARDTVNDIDDSQAWGSVKNIVDQSRKGLNEAYDTMGPLADIVP